jgi:CelD/BcsL family acetyltransferase involved in cellulose biosynthesis
MKLIPEADFARWNQFIRSAEYGTLFHTTWWYRAWGIEPQVYARENAQGEFEIGMILHVSRYGGARAIRYPPWTPINGPVFRAPRAVKRSEQYRQIKANLEDCLRSLPHLSLYDFTLPLEVEDVQPFLWHGFEVLPAYTYVLQASERENWPQHMAKDRKRKLNRAQKEAEERGYVIECNEDVNAVGALLLRTAGRQNFSLDTTLDRFARWWSRVQQQDAGRLYLLRDGNGRPVCATVLVWDNRTAYYLAGGIDPEVRDSNSANTLLFERMIRDTHAQGRNFDFEGSTIPGIEYFFRSWGGQLRHRLRVVKLTSPILYTIWHAHRYVTRYDFLKSRARSREDRG